MDHTYDAHGRPLAVYDAARNALVRFEPHENPGLALPHAWTFAGIIRGAHYTYYHLWDEAMRHSRENALAMRRDPYMMSLLQERMLGTASLRWHLEPDNPKDPWQLAVADGLTKLVRATPRLLQMMWHLLDAIWYGRSGVQIAWRWGEMDLPTPTQASSASPGRKTATGTKRAKCLLVDYHIPENGDKFGHHHSGEPYILVNAAEGDRLPNSEIITSSRGMALSLNGTWRERFIIHTHNPTDADFFENEFAEGLFGVGIRHVLYWASYTINEYTQWIMDSLNRLGLGQIAIEYDMSNPAAKAEAEDAAKKFSRNSVWLVPVTKSGTERAGAIRVIEAPVAGAQVLLALRQHLEGQIERYVIGQSMSGGADNESGLGGTGRAMFAMNTKSKIIAYDARGLGETLTGGWRDVGLVGMLKRYSYPWADFPVRLTFDLEDPEAERKMGAVSMGINMGLEFVADEVRALTGLSNPTEDDEVVSLEQVQAIMAEAQQAQQGQVPTNAPEGPQGEEAQGGASGADLLEDVQEDSKNRGQALGFARAVTSDGLLRYANGDLVPSTGGGRPMGPHQPRVSISEGGPGRKPTVLRPPAPAAGTPQPALPRAKGTPPEAFPLPGEEEQQDQPQTFRDRMLKVLQEHDAAKAAGKGGGGLEGGGEKEPSEPDFSTHEVVQKNRAVEHAARQAYEGDQVNVGHAGVVADMFADMADQKVPFTGETLRHLEGALQHVPGDHPAHEAFAKLQEKTDAETSAIVTDPDKFRREMGSWVSPKQRYLPMPVIPYGKAHLLPDKDKTVLLRDGDGNVVGQGVPAKIDHTDKGWLVTLGNVMLADRGQVHRSKADQQAYNLGFEGRDEGRYKEPLRHIDTLPKAERLRADVKWFRDWLHEPGDQIPEGDMPAWARVGAQPSELGRRFHEHWGFTSNMVPDGEQFQEAVQARVDSLRVKESGPEAERLFRQGERDRKMLAMPGHRVPGMEASQTVDQVDAEGNVLRQVPRDMEENWRNTHYRAVYNLVRNHTWESVKEGEHHLNGDIYDADHFLGDGTVAQLVGRVLAGPWLRMLESGQAKSSKDFEKLLHETMLRYFPPDEHMDKNLLTLSRAARQAAGGEGPTNRMFREALDIIDRRIGTGYSDQANRARRMEPEVLVDAPPEFWQQAVLAAQGKGMGEDDLFVGPVAQWARRYSLPVMATIREALKRAKMWEDPLVPARVRQLAETIRSPEDLAYMPSHQLVRMFDGDRAGYEQMARLVERYKDHPLIKTGDSLQGNAMRLIWGPYNAYLRLKRAQEDVQREESQYGKPGIWRPGRHARRGAPYRYDDDDGPTPGAGGGGEPPPSGGGGGGGAPRPPRPGSPPKPPGMTRPPGTAPKTQLVPPYKDISQGMPPGEGKMRKDTEGEAKARKEGMPYKKLEIEEGSRFYNPHMPELAKKGIRTLAFNERGLEVDFSVAGNVYHASLNRTQGEEGQQHGGLLTVSFGLHQGRGKELRDAALEEGEQTGSAALVTFDRVMQAVTSALRYFQPERMTYFSRLQDAKKVRFYDFITKRLVRDAGFVHDKKRDRIVDRRGEDPQNWTVDWYLGRKPDAPPITGIMWRSQKLERGEQPERYVEGGDGRWVTIGGQEGEDGKKHGGSPVYIEGGRITKGHPKLAGRKIGALREEPEWESHRAQVRQSEAYEKAKILKDARTLGIPPRDVQQLAGEMLSHDREFSGERRHLLQRARQLSEALGYGSLQGLNLRTARGIDADAVKGLDDVAERLAEEYPGHFAGQEPEARLFDMLTAGNPTPMTEMEALRQAFDHLHGQLEPVPFSRAERPERPERLARLGPTSFEHPGGMAPPGKGVEYPSALVPRPDIAHIHPDQPMGLMSHNIPRGKPHPLGGNPPPLPPPRAAQHEPGDPMQGAGDPLQEQGDPTQPPRAEKPDEEGRRGSPNDDPSLWRPPSEEQAPEMPEEIRRSGEEPEEPPVPTLAPVFQAPVPTMNQLKISNAQWEKMTKGGTAFTQRASLPDGRQYYVKKPNLETGSHPADPAIEAATINALRAVGHKEVPPGAVRYHGPEGDDLALVIAGVKDGVSLDRVMGDPKYEGLKQRFIRKNPPAKLAKWLFTSWVFNLAYSHELDYHVVPDGSYHKIDYGLSLAPLVESGWSRSDWRANQDALIYYGLVKPEQVVPASWVRHILDHSTVLPEMIVDGLKKGGKHIPQGYIPRVRSIIQQKLKTAEGLAASGKVRLGDLPEDGTGRLDYNQKGTRGPNGGGGGGGGGEVSRLQRAPASRLRYAGELTQTGGKPVAPERPGKAPVPAPVPSGKPGAPVTPGPVTPTPPPAPTGFPPPVPRSPMVPEGGIPQRGPDPSSGIIIVPRPKIIPQNAWAGMTPEEQLNVYRATPPTQALALEFWRGIPSDLEHSLAMLGGMAKRDWYGVTAHVLGVLRRDHEQFADLLAANSTRNELTANVIHSLALWRAWIDAGRPKDTVQIRYPNGKIGTSMPFIEELVREEPSLQQVRFPSRLPNTVNVLTGRKALSGPKVNEFSWNMQGQDLNHRRRVTNDVWNAVFQASAMDADFIRNQIYSKPGTYAMASAKIRLVANALGLDAREGQATLWSLTRTLAGLTKAGLTPEQAVKTITHEHIRAATDDFVDILLRDPNAQAELKRLRLYKRVEEAARIAKEGSISQAAAALTGPIYGALGGRERTALIAIARRAAQGGYRGSLAWADDARAANRLPVRRRYAADEDPGDVDLGGDGGGDDGGGPEPPGGGLGGGGPRGGPPLTPIAPPLPTPPVATDFPETGEEDPGTPPQPERDTVEPLRQKVVQRQPIGVDDMMEASLHGLVEPVTEEYPGGTLSRFLGGSYAAVLPTHEEGEDPGGVWEIVNEDEWQWTPLRRGRQGRVETSDLVQLMDRQNIPYHGVTDLDYIYRASGGVSEIRLRGSSIPVYCSEDDYKRAMEDLKGILWADGEEELLERDFFDAINPDPSLKGQFEQNLQEETPSHLKAQGIHLVRDDAATIATIWRHGGKDYRFDANWVAHIDGYHITFGVLKDDGQVDYTIQSRHGAERQTVEEAKMVFDKVAHSLLHVLRSKTPLQFGFSASPKYRPVVEGVGGHGGKPVYSSRVQMYDRFTKHLAEMLPGYTLLRNDEDSSGVRYGFFWDKKNGPRPIIKQEVEYKKGKKTYSRPRGWNHGYSPSEEGGGSWR